MFMSKNKLFQIKNVKSHLIIDLKSLASHFETHHLLAASFTSGHFRNSSHLKEIGIGPNLKNRPRFFERVGHVITNVSKGQLISKANFEVFI